MTTNWRQVAFQSAVNAGHPDPDMFVRQMLAESGLRPGLTSQAGASGIAQIMPATAKGWGVDPNDPYASLNAAAKAMTKYMRSYNGNAAMALAAYNAGPGAVAQYNGVPPYGETKAYIAKIMGGGKTGMTAQPQGRQAPVGRQVPGADPVAVSNQINRIQYAYGQHGALAQPHIDKLTASLTGTSGALANPTLEPAAVKATEGKGFFARKAGETGQQYLDRLLQKKFGLQHDPGNSQTTGGQHMQGSRHYQNLATDFGDGRNSPQVLQQAENWMEANRSQFVGGLGQVLYGPDDDKSGGHNDHLHGDMLRSAKKPKLGMNPAKSKFEAYATSTSIKPTNTRRRPVKKSRVPS